MDDLEKLYQQIDALDEQLTPLFAQRLKLARQIAQIKYARQLGIANRGREAQTIATQTMRVGTDLRPYLTDWYRDIILITKQCQAKLIKQLQDNEDQSL